MKKFYTLLVAVLTISATAFANDGESLATKNEGNAVQTTQDATLADKVANLEVRLAKAEKRAANWEKVKQYLKISGFAQGAYDWTDEDYSSTFHLRRARISISGDLYKGKKGAKLDYRFYFDLARLTKKAPMLDMWIRYQPFKEFGVQVGQFKNPFTMEASIGPNKYDFIDYSYAVCNLAKMGSNDVLGLDITARDLGFQFFGGFIHKKGFSVINYNLAVLNGSGINTKDNNKSKDIMARLTIKPLKELSIATYYQWGEAVWEKAVDYGWTGNTNYVTTHRWGGGVNYDAKSFFVRGEYIGGLSANLHSWGAYVSGGYRIYADKMPGCAWIGAMVDYYRYDVNVKKTDMRYMLCVGYEPIKYFRAQVGYSLEQRIGDGYIFKSNRPFRNTIKVLLTASF